PGVIVDGNDNIKMGGKNGVTILLDGRNPQLSGDDLAQVLKSIDASNIKQIEVITNPGSQYDAAGNAGIINIILKKSLTKGVNGNITANHSQSTHSRQNISTNLNARQGKWNVFGNGGINQGLQHTIANSDRITDNTTYTQSAIEKDGWQGYNFRVGADYNLNKQHLFGVMINGNYKNNNYPMPSYTLVQKTGSLDTTLSTQSDAVYITNRRNYNANYRYSSKKSFEVNVDADYTRFLASLDNTVSNQFANSNQQVFATYGNQNNVAANITIYSIKIDVSKITITKGWLKTAVAEAGLKLVTTTTNNNLEALNKETATYKTDTSKTNHFLYKEHINAAYGNITKSFKKLTVQLGLRAEQSNVTGTSTDLYNQKITKPDTTYINFFPTVFLHYKLKQNHQLGFSFGRRIDRPSYQDQNPFIYQMDSYNSQQGNPYLLPQITNNVEVSYTYKYASQVKISFSETSNLTDQLVMIDGKNAVQIPMNAGNRKSLNISVSTPITINKWFNTYVYAEPYYTHYTANLSGFGNQNNLNESGWGFNGYISNNFKITSSINAEISGWFNYQNKATIYVSKPIGSINIAASKQLLQKKATLKLALNDVLNTQRWSQSANFGNLNQSTYRKWESRNINISFTYRFGNNFIKQSRERATGSEAELGRIKTR
ncbi:MAG: TonB-dependent receptor, partial [Deinococcales bacterium]|nr:TonB-dependent receptor [Chitinophagaceae bacterium]